MKKLAAFWLIFQLANICYAGKYHPAIDYLFPLPASKMLPVKTTIILRLGQPYQSAIKNLGELISVSGIDGVYSGTTFFATDQHTIIFKPDQAFKIGEKVNVTIQTSQFYENDFSYQFQIYSNQLPVPRNEPSATLSKTEPFFTVKSTPPVRLIHGVAVPDDYPQITTLQLETTAPGMIFYGTNFPNSETGNYIIICKDDGTPYFYRKYANRERSVGFTLQPCGLLSVYLDNPGEFVVLDSHFVEIDTYHCGHGYTTDNHELILLENGHALLIAEEELIINMQKIVDNGRKNAMVQGNHIQELDRNKNVIFEWRSWDHFNIEAARYISLRARSIDYAHINSIAVDYDGHLVISSRNLCEVTKINRQNGEIIWRLGGVSNQFEYINENLKFIYQHDAQPVQGKPDHYTIFDNGVNRKPEFSRAVEYKLDVEQMTVEKVWEFRDPDGRFSSSMGSAQRFTNGNTLIDWPKKAMYAYEVTPENKIAFKFISRGHTNYRCRRYEWQGVAQTPYLLHENFNAIVRLIFNKFGDTEVQYYKIYYGLTPESLTAFDSTQATYYDVAHLRNNTQYYFRVTAVNNHNEEGDFSNTVTTWVRYAEPGKNLIKNGELNSLQNWDFIVTAPAQATAGIDDEGRLAISIANGGFKIDQVQLRQENILLLKGAEYQLEFDAYANTNRIIEAKLENKRAPNADYSKIGKSVLKRYPQHYQYPFKMKLRSDTDARLVFKCGLDPGDIYIDNVSLVYFDSTCENSMDTFVNINFQPADVAIPANYLRDCGEIFGIRPNGYHYGWLNRRNPHTQKRKTLLDNRYSTFNYLCYNDTSQTWEIEVPEGLYFIYLVMGDLLNSTQLNHIQIEDTILWDLDQQDQFDDYSVKLAVTDGHLTISPAEGAQNAKICFIDIRQSSSEVARHPVSTMPRFALEQNYPNPFNSYTCISYFITQPSNVEIQIFNILGHRVRSFKSQKMNAGHYTIKWNGKDDAAKTVASGVYFYTIQAGRFTDTKKLILLR